MGIYDRDYYRESYPESRGLHLRAPRSMAATLIVINVAIYLVDAIFFGKAMPIQDALALHSSDLPQPWLWWRFLTYGFVHDYSPMHIIFNMMQLFFLGRYIEQLYGKWEFLRLYLAALVASSVGWVGGTWLIQRFQNQPPSGFELVGASGAICTVVILFVLNYPHVKMMIFPIPIPIKAWVLGTMLILFNLFGSTSSEDNVAYGAHLAGIIFAWFYFYFRWNIGRAFSWLEAIPRHWGRPKFRVRRPDDEDGGDSAPLRAEVDRILEKIHRQGEDSLTRQERRTLEQASREFQRRRDAR
ncbi:MAG: rhomboid family intramembrane serine protease [Pirellulales bacterium]|nr:rhomboid family intramembrane serine protease [Pirellulales bacterium]